MPRATTSFYSKTLLSRATSIWAIGKFRNHLLSDTSEAAKTFMLMYLDTILATIKGSSIVAQDSAASVLKKLCKAEAEMIVELQPKLLSVFTTILQWNSYHKIFIYDTLAEFTETIHDEELLRNVLASIMPILLETFEKVKINEGSFVPLFECICSMLRSAKEQIEPYANRLLERVIVIAADITRVLKAPPPKYKSKEKVKLEYELNDNLMRCFDFVGTLSEAIPNQLAQLSSAKILPELIFTYLDTENVFLKQLVYSVLGDLIATLDKSLFEPQIDKIIAVLLEDAKVLPASMDPGKTYLSIATNALYAFSEVLERFPEKVNPELVLQKLLKIYENQKVDSVSSSFTSF